jgi:hypothetical protein
MTSSLQITEKEAEQRLRSAAAAAKKKKKGKKNKQCFKPQWVKLPARWVEALRRSKSASTYQLALTVLFEAFKREQLGGEIVLSMKITGMPSSTRARAVRELVKLGFITVKRDGKQAVRIINLRTR